MSDQQLLDYYSSRAGEYERIYEKPERQNDLQRVRGWLRAELAGHRILEIACGTGYWTTWLAPVAESIVATDLNPAVLALARQKPYPRARVRIEVADAYALGGVVGDFSAAFAGVWWSHLPRERQDDFLTSLGARLGPRALVVLLDNRFIEGSSTPIERQDSRGNTYQRRRLADGREYEVMKNFPGRTELRAALAPFVRDLVLTEFEYYWGARYTGGTSP
jgi:demethylmenaquinone methyltransferase/2-methoxy-6-polyprenyl-1,4-benzoquinol methylase